MVGTMKIDTIGKLRCCEAKEFEVEFKRLKMVKMGKFRRGDTKEIECKFEGLEIGKIGISR